MQILWFVLWGTLWTVYFMLDGFDFGVGMLRMVVARGEAERRRTIAAIGPVWNGNEVWLITAGGATFAAFPAVYASMFSFLYLPMLLILFSLILRGVAVEFRSKVDSAGWRTACDWVLAASSLVAPLVLGLGFGNIFQGLRFDSSGYHGSFLRLFNPFGLLTAVLFVVLFLQHGALWLAYRTDGELAERSRAMAGPLWIVALVAAAASIVSSGFATGLLDNYRSGPLWILAPLLAVAALVAVRLLQARSARLAAFLSSCATIVLVMAAGLIGLFPKLIPSSLDPSASLTIYNSSSGPYTLRVMTIVALIFVPIVIVYQFLVYRFFRGTVGEGEAAEGY